MRSCRLRVSCIIKITQYIQPLYLKSFLRVACRARCQMFWGCPGDKQMAGSWLTIKFETPWTPPESRREQTPSYCREGLGWTLLELTDASHALKKVLSRMAELIFACRRRLAFDHGYRRVFPPTQSSSMALCLYSEMFISSVTHSYPNVSLV